MSIRSFCFVVPALLGLGLLSHAGPSLAFDPFTPMSRAESFDSPRGDLPDQQFQQVKFRQPLATSLITASSFAPQGWGSMMIAFELAGGGQFTLRLREGDPDLTLALPRAALIESVLVRCDSFSAARCRYAVSLVGE